VRAGHSVISPPYHTSFCSRARSRPRTTPTKYKDYKSSRERGSDADQRRPSYSSHEQQVKDDHYYISKLGTDYSSSKSNKKSYRNGGRSAEHETQDYVNDDEDDVLEINTGDDSPLIEVNNSEEERSANKKPGYGNKDDGGEKHYYRRTRRKYKLVPRTVLEDKGTKDKEQQDARQESRKSEELVNDRDESREDQDKRKPSARDLDVDLDLDHDDQEEIGQDVASESREISKMKSKGSHLESSKVKKPPVDSQETSSSGEPVKSQRRTKKKTKSRGNSAKSIPQVLPAVKSDLGSTSEEEQPEKLVVFARPVGEEPQPVFPGPDNEKKKKKAKKAESSNESVEFFPGVKFRIGKRIGFPSSENLEVIPETPSDKNEQKDDESKESTGESTKKDTSKDVSDGEKSSSEKISTLTSFSRVNATSSVRMQTSRSSSSENKNEASKKN
jgi:hypothetical protein